MKDLLGDTPYSLYGGEPPAVRHSDTSQSAAEQIRPSVGSLHKEIIGFLSGRGDGATDDEMQREMPMAPNTQRPRRRELELAGRLVDSGERRPTKSGRKATVWVLKE